MWFATGVQFTIQGKHPTSGFTKQINFVNQNCYKSHQLYNELITRITPTTYILDINVVNCTLFTEL